MTYLPPRPITAGSRPSRTASRQRRWVRWAWLASLLLHLLAVLAMVLVVPGRRLSEPLPDPGFAVVFEGGTGEETQSSETGPLPTPQAPVPEAAPAPPTEQAEPETQPEPEQQPEPPVQQAQPEPPPQPEEPPPEEPPPEEPPQPEPETAQQEPPPEEPPQPEPETAQQEPPPAPEPRQQTQPAPPRVSPFPAPEDESADAPPFAAEPFRMPEPPPPPPPVPPRPRTPYAGVPVLPSNPFAAPRPAPAAPAAPRPPRRGLDLALGPVMPAPRQGGGQEAPESTMSVRGAEKLGADWRALFRAWLERHSRYPQEAAMMGQDGPVTVRFTVDRYGKVGSVELIRRSGSMYLDAATLGLLRGQTLPPFPPGTPQNEAEIDLTINYILIRR